MKLRRLARGPFLYITLGLLVVLALSNVFSGDGGYERADTAEVLQEIEAGSVSASADEPALLLD